MTAFSQRLLCFSPLEQFVRDYVEAREGMWDEIEPQVYDVLIGPDLMRVAFDPEALPEHPQAQLATLGSPLIDRLLADAAGRWNSARFYRMGLNLRPRDLEVRLRRAVSLPPEFYLRVERVRPLNFPQAVFWFEAMFSGDQKEEEILPIGIDLHHLREVRHLEALLAADRLSEGPELHLPQARHPGVAVGYRMARRHVVRTVAALANMRRREWAGRAETQVTRMSAYYAQLRREAEEQAARPLARSGADLNPNDAAVRAAARCAAIDRESRLRITELQRKSAVRVQVRLASLMVIQQPKLLIAAAAVGADQRSARLEAVWDPLSETVEAVICQQCGQPTFSLRPGRAGLVCPNCDREAPPKR